MQNAQEMKQLDQLGPDNLVELFETASKKYAKNKLFGTKNKSKTAYDWVTYEEVAKRVANLRGGLASLGINEGDGVAIIANNCTEWAIACYAAYGRNARFIPMYESELKRIQKFIIEDSQSKLLLVSRQDIFEKVKDFVDEIPSLEKIVVIEGNGEGSMAELEKIGAENPVEPIIPDGSSIAGFVYTSGTTGNPKGVKLSHRNLSSNVLAAYHAYQSFVDEEARSLSFLPWAHSYGQVAELHFLIYFGGSTGFAEAPTTIVDDLALVQPTMLVAVPRIFNKVYDALHKKMRDTGGLGEKLFNMGLEAAKNKREGNGGLLNTLKLFIADKVVFSKIRDKFGGRLQMAISSSAALNPEIAQFFIDLGIILYECWGMTELSPAHTLNTPEHNRVGSVGRPILGSWVVIDKTLTGEDSRDGEIIAYGPNVMQGYHNLPEVTAETLREDGGLHTGDLGYLDDEGYLYISGRIKEQYKLENGKYVFPAGIEESITASPYIENACIMGANKKYNVALIVPDFLVLTPWAEENGLKGTPEELVKEQKVYDLILSEVKNSCAQYANYEVPKKLLLASEVFSTESGILTPTLKLKRRVIEQRYGDQINALYDE